jgi:hypothetical protein
LVIFPDWSFIPMKRVLLVTALFAAAAFNSNGAQAACQTMKFKNLDTTWTGFIGPIPVTGISFGPISVTNKACWTPSTDRTSAQKVSSTDWVFVDSAPGNGIFKPGTRIRQGAFNTPASSGVRASSTSWVELEYKTRIGVAFVGVGLPGDQPTTVRVELKVQSNGNCKVFVNGQLKSSGNCVNFVP